MAVAVVVYFDAIGIVTGGVTGIAIIIKQYANIPMWIVNTVLNVPLFFIGIKRFGIRRFIKTVYATFMLSFFLGIIPKLDILTGDKLADVIVGAFFMGSGIGIILLQGASSGGADLLAVLLHKRFMYWSVPRILLIIDGVIVLAGVTVFGIKIGVYAIIAVYVVTKVSDNIIDGFGRKKLIYIISRETEAIVTYISTTLERGASCIDITGAYTKIPREMIMCVANKHEMVEMKKKVYEIDENAICFIGDIREAFGEGFTKLSGV